VAQSTTLQLVGVLHAQPAPASLYSQTLQELLPLSFSAVYGAVKGGVIPVASTDLAPFTLPLEGIVKGRVFAMRLMSGATMKLRITTALGTAVLNVSGQFLLHAPATGDQFTAIQLVGTGDVAYAIAGDVT
jgi:hypothetical protein